MNFRSDKQRKAMFAAISGRNCHNSFSSRSVPMVYFSKLADVKTSDNDDVSEEIVDEIISESNIVPKKVFVPYSKYKFPHSSNIILENVARGYANIISDDEFNYDVRKGDDGFYIVPEDYKINGDEFTTENISELSEEFRQIDPYIKERLNDREDAINKHMHRAYIAGNDIEERKATSKSLRLENIRRKMDFTEKLDNIIENAYDKELTDVDKDLLIEELQSLSRELPLIYDSPRYIIDKRNQIISIGKDIRAIPSADIGSYEI